MPAMNRVWIMGTLTRDPAVRELPSGSNVAGRLHYEQWRTDNGENRAKLKVRADRVQFLGRSGDAEEA